MPFRSKGNQVALQRRIDNMIDFRFDPDGVEVLSNRLGRGSRQIEDLAAGLQQRLSAAAELSSVEAPAAQARLNVIATQWRLGSSSLRERVRQFEAAEITAEDLASVDLVAEVDAARLAEATAIADALLADEIAKLVAETDPIITRGFELREGLRNVRIGPDEYKFERYYYMVDSTGTRTEVTVEGRNAITEYGTFPIVATDGGPVILFEGKTPSQQVIDNLNGVGDGTTPTFGQLIFGASVVGAAEVFGRGQGEDGERTTDDTGARIDIDDPRPNGFGAVVGAVFGSVVDFFGGIPDTNIEVIKDPEKPETGDEPEFPGFSFSVPIGVIDEVLGTDFADATGLGLGERVNFAEIAEKFESIPVLGDVLDAIGLSEVAEFVGKGKDDKALPENLADAAQAVGALAARAFEAIGNFFGDLFDGDDGDDADDRESSGGITDAEQKEFGGRAEDFENSNGLL